MECYYQLENDNIHLEIRDEILHERKYKKKKKNPLGDIIQYLQPCRLEVLSIK
jgi:hypothetical protein